MTEAKYRYGLDERVSAYPFDTTRLTAWARHGWNGAVTMRIRNDLDDLVGSIVHVQRQTAGNV
jgi:hypothetical protein